MIHVNGRADNFLSESVDELLSRLAVERRGIAVALDGEIVRRSDWASTFVPDESSVEIVTAAAGG
ncbi:MAG TPA: sulfur carrier protein ThiS [Acidimicrobiales bacterium]|nr:sulfur carrier protein ThiS [Acidimicrobiales bacterium]